MLKGGMIAIVIGGNIAMKTVQMTIDEELIAQVDEMARKLHTSRSAFTRDALRLAVRRYREAELEAAHREGYRTRPAAENEFAVQEEDRRWGDEW